MKLKFLYNTLLTIGIVLMFLSAIAAFKSGQYPIMAFSIAVLLLLFYLKIRLLREVREATRKKGSHSHPKKEIIIRLFDERGLDHLCFEVVVADPYVDLIPLIGLTDGHITHAD